MAEEYDLGCRIYAGRVAEKQMATACRIPPRVRRQLEKIIVDGRNAVQRLVECNQALVTHWVRRMLGSSPDWEDYVQDGMIGLIRAAEKFEPHRKIRFSTYAYHWIRQAIQRSVRLQRHLIHLPAYVHEQRRRITEALSAAPAGKQRYEQAAMLLRVQAMTNANTAGSSVPLAMKRLSPAHLRDIEMAVNSPLSLHCPAPDNGRSLVEHISDPHADTEALALKRVEHLNIRTCVQNLPNPERMVVLMRFFHDSPHAAIARKLGLSVARVKKIEQQALAMLRSDLQSVD